MLVKKKKPEWLMFVTLATAIYLCIELAFNARLLDVIGNLASAEQLHHIESYGRAISGFAVALMLWGWLIESSRSPKTGRLVWSYALLRMAATRQAPKPSV